jgi:hypothetical protein
VTFSVQEIFKLLAISSGSMKFFTDIPHTAFLKALAIPSCGKCAVFSVLAMMPIFCDKAVSLLPGLKQATMSLSNWSKIGATAFIEFNDLNSVVLGNVASVCREQGAGALLVETLLDMINVGVHSISQGQFSLFGSN